MFKAQVLSVYQVLWVEGNDEEVEGEWLTSAGVPIPFGGWSQGEPGGFSREQCRALTDEAVGIGILDISCDTEHPALCKTKCA